MIIKPVERQNAKPILLRLTPADRTRVELWAKSQNMPKATFIYQLLKEWLDEHDKELMSLILEDKNKDAKIKNP